MKIHEWLYLNIYAISLLLLSVLVFLFPLFLVSWIFIPFQIAIGLFTLSQSMRLFSTFAEKKRMISILLNRNNKEFHASSFEPYMKAPCSRLIVHFVLKKINLQKNYQQLLHYKPSVIETCKENSKPIITTITYGDSFK